MLFPDPTQFGLMSNDEAHDIIKKTSESLDEFELAALETGYKIPQIPHEDFIEYWFAKAITADSVSEFQEAFDLLSEHSTHPKTSHEHVIQMCKLAIEISTDRQTGDVYSVPCRKKGLLFIKDNLLRNGDHLYQETELLETMENQICRAVMPAFESEQEIRTQATGWLLITLESHPIIAPDLSKALQYLVTHQINHSAALEAAGHRGIRITEPAEAVVSEAQESEASNGSPKKDGGKSPIPFANLFDFAKKKFAK